MNDSSLSLKPKKTNKPPTKSEEVSKSKPGINEEQVPSTDRALVNND